MVVASELDVVLGLGFLLTVHNVDWDPRTGHHLANGVAPILKRGPDHLLWAIADDLIDGYFPFADRIGDAIDDVQDEVIRKATPDTVEQLFKLKRELIQVRRAISPVREVFNQLTNRDEKLIDPDEIIYFRDIYDHVIRLTDELDNYRELASATLDVYLTQVNNNLSVIMKRLTGVTVILAGIGAVAGIFGMSEAARGARRRRGHRLLGDHRGSSSRRPASRPSSCAGSTGSDRRGAALQPRARRPSRAPRGRARRPAACRAGRSAAARTSSGMPCGPVTATARPSMAPACRAARRTANPSASLLSSPKATTVAGSRSASSARTPRACRPRSAAAGRRRAARGSGPGRAAASSRSTSAMAASTAARAAARSSAWRTWNATDGPLRSTNSQAGRPSSSGTRVASTSAGASDASWPARNVVCDAGRVAAAPERAGLQAVVAEVADAADADPCRDVRRRFARSGSRRDTRSGRAAATRASRRRARRASGTISRGRRVARALGQRPVEVAHDEQAPRPRPQPADRADRGVPLERGTAPPAGPFAVKA